MITHQYLEIMPSHRMIAWRVMDISPIVLEPLNHSLIALIVNSSMILQYLVT